MRFGTGRRPRWARVWLASGGAYWILGGAWLLGAVLFATFSIRAGAARGEEGDGCVLAIGTIVTMSVGAGIGLQVAPYPWFVLTALFLGLVFPLGLMLFLRRRR